MLAVSTMPGPVRCHLLWCWGVGGMTARLFVMLRDPFVGTGSPAPLRRRLGGDGVCVPKLEDGHLMVFNPLNPGDRPAEKMVPEAPQSQRLSWQSRLGGGPRDAPGASCLPHGVVLSSSAVCPEPSDRRRVACC